MNDTDVQAPNSDCKPKLHKNYQIVLQIWLVHNNVVTGSTKMLTQEHVALDKIRFCNREKADIYKINVKYLYKNKNPLNNNIKQY